MILLIFQYMIKIFAMELLSEVAEECETRMLLDQYLTSDKKDFFNLVSRQITEAVNSLVESHQDSPTDE